MLKSCVKFLLIAISMTFSIHLSTASAQQKITPSHVYQVADDVVNELTLLLEADFSDQSIPSTETFKGKKPRHVIQKARLILLKVQLLQEINGITPKKVEMIPVREIQPADVKDWVEKILTATRELREPYGITAESTTAPLPSGKTPSDVYTRLVQAEYMLGRLDIPATVPNDVFRFTLAMLDDVKLLASTLGVNEKFSHEDRKTSPKNPGQVYDESYALLETLKKLTELNESLNIPGGIVLPQKKTGKRTPGDVIDLQNTILAELSSLKNKVKAAEPTKMFPPQVAKTPTNVFLATQTAKEYLEAVIKTVSSNS